MDHSAIKIKLTFANGKTIEREWSAEDAPFESNFEPPHYLENMRKHWNRPQNPITYEADVRWGHFKEARKWLEEIEKA